MTHRCSSAMLPGTKLGQLAVMFGLIAGSVLAAITGALHLERRVRRAAVRPADRLFPFGIAEIQPDRGVADAAVLSSSRWPSDQPDRRDRRSGRPHRSTGERDVPRTILGDALMSLIGGLFRHALIITSGENIGIVRATGVRSRLCHRHLRRVAGDRGCCSRRSARLANAIPGPWSGAPRSSCSASSAAWGSTCSAASTCTRRAICSPWRSPCPIGLLPILVPGLYGRFPRPMLQIILGNGLAMGTLAAVLANILFNHLGRPWSAETGRSEAAGQELMHGRARRHPGFYA